MSRQERLVEVLAARADQAQALTAAVNAATNVQRDLENLASELRSLRAAADASRSMSGLLSEVAEAVKIVEQELARSHGTVARLLRPTLSVGVVGQARTGKSRFLQSLTGLGPECIPDSPEGFCTGVTSVIRAAQQFSATVTFKTQANLLQQLAPYYEKLGAVAPTTLSQVALPPKVRAIEDDAALGELYRHLAGYVHNLADFQQHLDGGVVSVLAADVRGWVTQSDAAGHEQNGFRAVERLEMSAPFAMGLSGLSVVDLPGLGDTNLTDAARMLAALTDDVDVIVIVRRPDASGDDWNKEDVNLYQRAAESLLGISMKDRAFIALNRMREPDNNRQCERFQQLVPERSFTVAATRIVDASSVDEVTSFFDAVLEHLIVTAGVMDRTLVLDRLQGLARLPLQVDSVLRQGREWIGDMADASPRAATELVRLRKEAMADLYSGLERLLNESRGQSGDPDESLTALSDEVIAQAREDKGLPTPEMVERRVAKEGGRSVAYLKLLNESRAHLSRHLVNLEPALDVSLSELKEQVAQILIDSRLGALAGGEGESWLRNLATEFGLVLGENSTVREALMTLSDARLTYRGFLQHRIRPLLSGLSADTPTHPMLPEVEYSEEVIVDLLEASYDSALGDVDLFLRTDISSEPSLAVFAVAEEFVDRMLRSRNAEDEWHAIYQHFKNQIWPGKWEGLTEDQVEVMKVRRVLDALANRSADLEKHVAVQ